MNVKRFLYFGFVGQYFFEKKLRAARRLDIDTWMIVVQQDALLEISKLTGVGDAQFTNFMRGYKVFELSDHLGNVLATVSDDKPGISPAATQPQLF
ncbi:hypothetical protein ACTJJ0_11675 [Chitinophaga sp. 22321]|uniref:Uncharacterized protein n=1 Tax=Chitinophaga hostae TaxID=2831022 RepID=A0ABS5IWE8_9BACT|nr:hypothetical protein [Chitinophaga hostae]MBS0027190.1 hypothetical protein [Chitinophaga hostae]